MPIEHMPKGGLPDPIDERDYKIEVVGELPPIDWNKGSGLQIPPIALDQGTSDTCGPHATTKYHWQLKRKDFSVRDLAARVMLPTYGSFVRDNIMAIVNQGQATKDEVPDPQHPTPQNMRDKTGVTPEKESDDREVNGFVINARDIETCGRAIAAYRGVVLGLYGTNEGWRNMEVPEPPKGAVPLDIASRPEIWGHLLYANDWHLHNGEKCIIAPASWPEVQVHHIRERYFKQGWTFNPWTLIPKEQTSMIQLIRDKGTVYMVAGNNRKVKTGIADQAVIDALFGDEEIKDGDTSSIPQSQTAASGFVIHKV